MSKKWVVVQAVRLIYCNNQADMVIGGEIRIKDIMDVHHDVKENWKMKLTVKTGRSYVLEDPERKSVEPWIKTLKTAWKTALSPVTENAVSPTSNTQVSPISPSRYLLKNIVIC